jgi:hypothetical protein
MAVAPPLPLRASADRRVNATVRARNPARNGAEWLREEHTGDMGAVGDDALRGELIRQITAMLDVLVSQAQRERARRGGVDAEWLDGLLEELRGLAEQTHDLDLTRTIRDIVSRHGSGPWQNEDLAAIAGADLVTLRRVLDALRAAGLAWPEPDETGL